MFDSFRTDAERRYRAWSMRNQQGNGLLAVNQAFTACCVALFALVVVMLFQSLNPTADSDQTAQPAPGSPSFTVVFTSPQSSVPSAGTHNSSNSSDRPSDTPFYDRGRPATKAPIAIVVSEGCTTKYMGYKVSIYGLTPHGQYWAQTDWNRTGDYVYGQGGYADSSGRAVYTWDCYDNASGIPYLMQPGLYSLHITDATTGFSKSVGLSIYDDSVEYAGGK